MLNFLIETFDLVFQHLKILVDKFMQNVSFLSVGPSKLFSYGSDFIESIACVHFL